MINHIYDYQIFNKYILNSDLFFIYKTFCTIYIFKLLCNHSYLIFNILKEINLHCK